MALMLLHFRILSENFSRCRPPISLVVVRDLRIMLAFVVILSISFIFSVCGLLASVPQKLPASTASFATKSRSSALQAISTALPVIESATAVAGVIAFHEAGHFSAARVQGIKVDSFSIGFGPKLLSFNDSTGVEFCLRALPLGGYVAFPQNIVFDDEGNVTEELDDPDLLQNRPAAQRALVISAGVIANLILAFLLSAGTAATSGIGHPVYDDGILITSTPSLTAAGPQAGLKVDDIIASVDGQKLKGSETEIPDFVSIVRQSGGKHLKLDVIRDGEPKVIDVTPRGDTGKGSIGVGVNARINHVDAVRATNPIDAAKEGFRETTRLCKFTASAFSRAFSSGFTGTEVGGPISVVKAGASMAAYSNIALIGFAATLSINLAILNSLPLPALDGGQLAFILVEGLAGRKIDRALKETIIAVAFGILVLIGAGSFVTDLSNLGKPIETLRGARVDQER